MVRKAIYILVAVTVLLFGILLLLSYSLVPDDGHPADPAAVEQTGSTN